MAIASLKGISIVEGFEPPHIVLPVWGGFKPGAIAYLQRVIARMKDEEKCGAAILGCTEIPLILDDTNSPLPTLNSTRMLARAALRQAVEDVV